jgi:Zn-dependent protease
MCSARLGDPSPKKKGFLSGNPFRYFETVGFFCMLIFRYGWGQPVPTAPVYYKDRRRGILITYITPSVVNLLVGIITAALMRLFSVLSSPLLVSPAGWPRSAVGIGLTVMQLFASCNIGLALFNIIPVYPLDGAKILQLFLKPDLAVRMNHYEKIFQIILLLLMALGAIHYVIEPITNAIIGLIWMG